MAGQSLGSFAFPRLSLTWTNWRGNLSKLCSHQGWTLHSLAHNVGLSNIEVFLVYAGTNMDKMEPKTSPSTLVEPPSLLGCQVNKRWAAWPNSWRPFATSVIVRAHHRSCQNPATPWTFNFRWSILASRVIAEIYSYSGWTTWRTTTTTTTCCLLLPAHWLCCIVVCAGFGLFWAGKWKEAFDNTRIWKISWQPFRTLRWWDYTTPPHELTLIDTVHRAGREENKLPGRWCWNLCVCG